MVPRVVIASMLVALLAACGATPAAPTGGVEATTAATAAPAGGEAATAAPAAAATTAPAASGEKLRLTIGTGGTGGVFFPYGGGVARILTAKMPNTEATAQETGGSVDNMKLIQTGEAQVGFSTVDSAFDAINGKGAYAETGPVQAQTIAVLYQSFVHVVATQESGIADVAGMKGKRVSVGSAGSSTEAAADRVLEAGGLNPQADVSRENLSVADSVSAIKDGKIDAFFWIGGLPTSAVTDLTTTGTPAVTFIPTGQYVAPMIEKYGPLYSEMTLPTSVYKNIAADVPGIGIGNIIFVGADMSEDTVYAMLTTLFDNLAETQAVHPEAKKFSLDTAWTGSSIPFHPGAIRFYKEKGVWKDS
ncbi:MAG: TAXI family TRAP transporter solute-binding subunit [Chloroflexales bacterium]|nr:TAXI family TRAP transporter solute-binding subunit [Chloroflexales bacterium]